MTDPFLLLNTESVDFEKASEAKAVLEFAEKVVEDFYHDLHSSVARIEAYVRPFLCMSSDKITFDGASDSCFSHGHACKSGTGLQVIGFRDGLTASDVARAFCVDEEEMRVELMVVIINLRQIELLGSTREAERSVSLSVERLRAMLGYAMLLI
jgi:hypothetical protein